jgi:hypothetical protein
LGKLSNSALRNASNEAANDDDNVTTAVGLILQKGFQISTTAGYTMLVIACRN